MTRRSRIFISYSLFQKILTSLLKENVPIKDLETIIESVLETISDTGLPIKDVDGLIENIRTALKRTIPGCTARTAV